MSKPKDLIEIVKDPLASKWRSEAMCLVEIPVALSESVLAYAHKTSDMQAENRYLKQLLRSADQNYLQLMDRYIKEMEAVKAELEALKSKI